jgi:hypothetical protein
MYKERGCSVNGLLELSYRLSFQITRGGKEGYLLRKSVVAQPLGFRSTYNELYDIPFDVILTSRPYVSISFWFSQ